MFKLTNLSNTLYTYPDLGIPIALVNNSIDGAKVSKIELSKNTIYNPVNNEVIIVDTEYNVGDEIVIDLDNTVVNVDTITIGNQIYVYSDTDTPGTFYYNSNTNQLTIRPSTRIVPNTFISISYYSAGNLDDQIKQFNYSNFIKIDGYNITGSNIIEYFNITGTVSITQNYNDYPTTSLSLVVDNAKLKEFRTILKNTDRKWIIANIPFRVQSYNEIICKQEQYPSGYIQINLNFEGWYKRLLGKSIFIRKKAYEDNYECTIENKELQRNLLLKQETTNPDDPETFIVSIQTLAERTGVKIKGETLYIKYPINTPGNAVTTLESAISSVLSERPDLYFVYSKLDGIHIEKWNQPRNHKNITENLIISEINNGYNLDENIKNIYPTTITWNNTKNKINENEEVTKEKGIPEYEKIIYKEEISIQGDEDYKTPYIETLDSLTYNYDVSGRTKTFIKNIFEGTDIIKTESEIWGFAYNSDDIGDFDGNNIFRMKANSLPYWKIVEKKVTEYIYDNASGYLLGTKNTGYKLIRYKQETDEECQIAFLKDEGGDALKEVFIYRWFKQPLTESTTYKLAQLTDFYNDLVYENEDQFIVYTFCDKFGKLQAGYILNPDFVYPRFAISTETIYDCYSEKNHPLNSVLESGDIENPKLKSGEYKKVTQNIKIRKTKFTSDVPITLNNYIYGNEINVSDLDKEVKDAYTVFEKVTQSGDSDFKNNAENTNSVINEGRPSEHTRRSPRYKLKEDGTVQDKEQNKKESEEIIYDYILYTEPYTGKEQVNNTKYYNVKTLEKAKKYFEYEYEKTLFNNTANNSLVCIYLDNIYEGDMIKYYYNNEYINKFRIKSVNKTFNIKGAGLLTGTISFNGNSNYLDNNTKLDIKELKKRKKPDKPKLELVILLPPYYEGSII